MMHRMFHLSSRWGQYERGSVDHQVDFGNPLLVLSWTRLGILCDYRYLNFSSSCGVCPCHVVIH